MAPGRVDKFLYVAIVSVLAIMPGMMTLLPPAIKHFMGTKDIGLKFGLVLTGEVSYIIGHNYHGLYCHGHKFSRT